MNELQSIEVKVFLVDAAQRLSEWRQEYEMEEVYTWLQGWIQDDYLRFLIIKNVLLMCGYAGTQVQILRMALQSLMIVQPPPKTQRDRPSPSVPAKQKAAAKKQTARKGSARKKVKS
jgi:hypothetical protein